MAKQKVKYVCQNCGATFPKWLGRCPECGAWNTIIEVPEIPQSKSINPQPTTTAKSAKSLSEISSLRKNRIKTGINELDRVLGGGFVPGSVVLLAGEPGIGKSTLALQMAFSANRPILYASGEESLEQIKLRAERLQIANDQVKFLSETLLENILQVVQTEKPQIVIIDSIQTTQTQTLESLAGSVSQIRETAAQIQQFAKQKNISFLLIGHITKQGQIAGPKILEHIVDTVLQFEGDRNYMYRILRSVKNRFGSTSEIGIFEMQNTGLVEITNPSQLLMSPSKQPLSGVSIAASIEGLRAFMIEVQALVSTAVYGTPQRSAIGFDNRRLSMLLAVLEKRLGMRLGNKDVFLNIAGGIKVDDPGIDLAVVSSIISSSADIALPKNVCFAAEVGLTGEIRPVHRIEQRIKEAEKLGFEQIFISRFAKINFSPKKIRIVPIGKVSELLAHLEKFKF